MKRITNPNITKLEYDEIFVFGSNLSGLHAGGAARIAHQVFGAKWGVGYGLTGKTYAIPTKSHSIRRTLLVGEIKPYVDMFIDFASDNTQFKFLVTEIGCGLAGLKVEQVAPLFERAMKVGNIHLPESFWKYLEHLENVKYEQQTER